MKNTIDVDLDTKRNSLIRDKRRNQRDKKIEDYFSKNETMMKGTFSQKEQISFIGCTRPSSGCLGSRRRLAGCSLRPTSRRRRNRPENKK